MFLIGTSGFSYKEWKGSFYPEDLPASKFLSFYSRQLPTTEINATYYRMPKAETCQKWGEQVSGSFLFTLKMNQRVTHRKRLVDVDDEMSWYLENVEPLRDRLGCLLIQLPPWSRQNLDALSSFLENWGQRAPMAFEFRHESWMDPATYEVLREHEAALVITETDDQTAVKETTAPFAYLRLRRSDYDLKMMDGWADWLLANTERAFVYFKHEEKAPELAQDLLSRLQP